MVFNIIYLFIFVACTPIPITYTYSKFVNESFEKTNPDEIIVYSRRLDIDAQFMEIGVIIIKGTEEVYIGDIKEKAANYGATGIVREGKNFVLIRLLSRKNEKNIENINKI